MDSSPGYLVVNVSWHRSFRCGGRLVVNSNTDCSSVLEFQIVVFSTMKNLSSAAAFRALFLVFLEGVLAMLFYQFSSWLINASCAEPAKAGASVTLERISYHCSPTIEPTWRFISHHLSDPNTKSRTSPARFSQKFVICSLPTTTYCEVPLVWVCHW